jgi:glutamate racemase
MRTVRAALPDENLLYVADGANCPYGTRPASEIRDLSVGISRFLVDRGAKLIVVACNTASAAALSALRAAFDIPFVGVVPPVKPAAGMSATGVVGVLGTPTTFGGALYHEVIEHHASGARVIAQVCDGLVERVEQGDIAGPDTLALLSACLAPIMRAGADTLVLGCTHYPFLIPAIRQVAGDALQILEPSEAVARQIARVLVREGLQRPSGEAGGRGCSFATSGNADALARMLAQLVGWEHAVTSLRWIDGALQTV